MIILQFLKLPTELLLLICPLLPFPAQVCLALTCKHMYQLFGSVLDDERLCFPRVLSNKKFEISPIHRILQENRYTPSLKSIAGHIAPAALSSILTPSLDFGYYESPIFESAVAMQGLCTCTVVFPCHLAIEYDCNDGWKQDSLMLSVTSMITVEYSNGYSTNEASCISVTNVLVRIMSTRTFTSQ